VGYLDWKELGVERGAPEFWRSKHVENGYLMHEECLTIICRMVTQYSLPLTSLGHEGRMGPLWLDTKERHSQVYSCFRPDSLKEEDSISIDGMMIVPALFLS